MTLAELIAKTTPALADLDKRLSELLVEFPDAADTLQPIIDALRGAGTADNLFRLGQEVMRELAALPSTGINPKFHGSDLAG